MPAIWASFRNKMIDDAMISNFLQPQSLLSAGRKVVMGEDGTAFVHRSDSDLLVNRNALIFRAVGSSELHGRFIRGSSEPKRYPVALIFQYPIVEALKQRPKGI
jgi:hypothetical protein